jgi:hypothetical protein
MQDDGLALLVAEVGCRADGAVSCAIFDLLMTR